MSAGNFNVRLIEQPDAAQCEAVNAELRRLNETENSVYWEASGKPENDAIPINLFAFDDDGGVIGGLFGSTRFSWLKIDVMATRADLRRSGIGKALVKEAERLAAVRGCKYVYVDTMDFQAPGFYEKLGYEGVGRIEDWDSHGHAKLFFSKRL